MNTKRNLNLILTIFFILLISLSLINTTSASFTRGNNSYEIQKEYSQGEFLSGWINVSFQDEPLNSVISIGSGNQKTLGDFLEQNAATYDCLPSDCESGFAAANSGNSKSFFLGANGNKIIGLRVWGGTVDPEEGITMKLKIRGNAPASCTNQLLIDFFGDNIVDMGNDKPFPEECPATKTYGCFNKGAQTIMYNLENDVYYCQKLKLSVSPAFKLGAWITKNSQTVTTSKPTLKIYRTDGTAVTGRECSISSDSITSEGGEVSCTVNYTNLAEEDYFVCVTASGTTGYKIRANSNNTEKCGFSTPRASDIGDKVENLTGSYQISAEGMKFDAIQELNLDGSKITDFTGTNLNEQIKNYLQTTYNYNCASDCIIPIKIKGNVAQQVILSNLELKYYTTASGWSTETNFYDITEISPRVNSNFIKLDLEKLELPIRGNYGNSTLTLSIGNETFLSERIRLLRAPVIDAVFPTQIPAGVPTEFNVVASPAPSGGNISSYTWFFGDGTNITTSEKKITHTYSETGLYDLVIKVTDNSGLSSSKTFGIQVGSSRDAINSTLKTKIAKLAEIKTKIESYPTWYQSSMENKLKTADIESSLTKVERDFAMASTEDEFTPIMLSLQAISIPKDIGIMRSAELPFFPDPAVIDLNYFNKAGFSTTDVDQSKADQYKKGIFGWENENVDAKVKYEQIVAYSEDSATPILSVFEFNIKPRASSRDEFYLFIKSMAGLKIKEEGDLGSSYHDKTSDGFIYIDLDPVNGEKTITVLTTEDLNFENVPVFISPELSKVGIVDVITGCNNNGKCDSDLGETWGNCKDCKSSSFFFFLIGIIVFIALIVYILLQEWYKKKYEKHLFKSSNDVYNLLVYIDNGKRKGMTDEQLKEALKKSNWNSEQIQYIINKYYGKRTGMFEIPIDKWFRKLNLKKQPIATSAMIKQNVVTKNQEQKAKKPGFFSGLSGLFKKKPQQQPNTALNTQNRNTLGTNMTKKI